MQRGLEDKMSEEKNVILQIKDFSQGYNTLTTVVNHISLEVKEGEIFGFIGHNGAGKSTTIKSIVGILPIDKGEIWVAGKNIAKHQKECQRQCAYIPDNPDLYGYMTGIDYINFIADIFEVTEENRTKRIKELADEFEITAELDNLISSYSHGMKQKVALIAAFVHEPKLLVLDEPFVGLDPKASAVLKKNMRRLCDEGNAIFFSTHVLEVAERLCDRVAMIHHGNLLFEGDMKEVIQKSTLEEVFLEKLSLQEEGKNE